MAKLFKSEKEIVHELKSRGYMYKDADDIYRQKKMDPEVVNVILKWLPKVYIEHYGTADILVRSLMGAKEPINPSPLIELFDKTDLNFSLKSGIAYTLVFAKTQDISVWIKDQLLNKDYSIERSALIEGLNNKGRFSSAKELMNFIRKIFDKYHDEEVLKLFKKFGDHNDILFLENYLKSADKKLAKQIIKIIEAIKKRIE